MKKLLLPFEGNRFPCELLDFVRMMQAKVPMVLTAAFVRESDYATVLQGCELRVGSQGYELPVVSQGASYGRDEQRMVDYHSRLLRRFCEAHAIKYRIHAGSDDLALVCLRKESRYADLMALSSKHLFEEADQEQPNAWMKEMLRHSECPVLLLPDQATLPGELILAYDGSAASVYAIRQFAYLFPELCHLQATLVYLNDYRDSKIPEADAIRDLGMSHFRKFRMLKLEMKSADFYDTWIGMMSNPWLISGSFGRGAFSEVFRRSFSDELIRRHQVPVFVAHK